MVFCVALAVRGFYLWEMRESAFFGVLIGDARHYDGWARQIAAGDWRCGDQVFWQAPLYQYFMGTVFLLVGHNVWLLRLFQILLGASSSCLLVVAGRGFFNRQTGIIAGLLLAVAPDAVYFDALVQKPVLDIWLASLLLALFACFLARPAWWWACAIGIALGFLIVNRENARLLVPIEIVWIAWAFRAHGWPKRLLWMGMLLVGAMLPAMPFAMRNLLVGGQFVVSSTGLGHNFYIGNNEQADGTYQPLRPGRGDPMFEPVDAREIAEEELGQELTPREVSNYWLQRSWQYIRTQPTAWLKLMLHKWGLVWNAASLGDAETIDAFDDRSLLLGTLAHGFHFGVLVPLAVLGIWVTRRDAPRLAVLYVNLLVLAASIAAFFIFGRYRASMMPFLVLFAAAGVGAFWAASKSGGLWHAVRQQWVGLLLAALVAIYTNRSVDTSAMQTQTYLNYAKVHGTLGIRYQERGDRTAAVQHYRWALSLWPAAQIPEATANLAWILATAPEPELQQGAESVAWVEQLGTPEQTDDPVLLDVMGAALAAGGRYSEAMRAAKKAVARAEETDQSELAGAIRVRQAEYARGRSAVVASNAPPFPGVPSPPGESAADGSEQLYP